MKSLLILSLLISFLFSASAFAATIKEVEGQLFDEIKLAKQNYQRQYENITKQRNKLLAQLATQEGELKKLSVKAKLITRVKDEQNPFIVWH